MIGRTLLPLEEMRYNPTMPKPPIIPALCAFFLIIPSWSNAQIIPPVPPGPVPSQAPAAAASAPAAPPTAAEEVIDDAIKKLKALASVSCTIEMSVQMLNQSFRLEGQYLRAPQHRTKLQLILTGLGDSSGKMLQICDGATLWDYSQVLSSQSCQKLQVEQIVKRLDNPDCDAQIRDQAYTRMGLTGPETLLQGLRKALAFNQKEAGTFEGKSIWILRGEWKDRSAPGMPAAGPLPPIVTNIAEVWIGQDDGWPYRIQLASSPSSVVEKGQQAVNADGRPASPKLPAAKRMPNKVILLWHDVVINPKLDPGDFAFEPPAGIPVQDGTEQIVGELDKYLADAAARKKTDTSGSNAVLDQTLTVPKPPAEPGALPPPKVFEKPKS
jgi:outer membrane lipoprotein-sorting protein